MNFCEIVANFCGISEKGGSSCDKKQSTDVEAHACILVSHINCGPHYKFFYLVLTLVNHGRGLHSFELFQFHYFVFINYFCQFMYYGVVTCIL